ncbi:MAG: hypothetical protein ACLFVN_12855 [Phycisphaeraceae bacterium]
MPIIENDLAAINTPQDRMRLLLSEQRTAPAEPEQPPGSGFGETFAAIGRTGNTLGSFVSRRFARMLSGYSPLYGTPTGIEGDWDPGERLSDPDFYRRNPWAIQGYDQLAAARDPDEFELTNLLLQDTWKDHETMANASGPSLLAAGLAVNLADPVNFVPFGSLGKVKKGAGLAKLLKNATRYTAIGAGSNLAQEELLHALDPGRPVDRVEADLAATGMGALFGGAIGFLASPNYKPSARGLRKFVPSGRVEEIRGRVTKLFEQEIPEQGRPPRNVVPALEEGEQTLRTMLDEPPRDDASVAVLHRRDQPEAGVPADTNGKMLRQLERKYEQAGKTLHVVEHPLQKDYDAFEPLERVLNDTAQRLRRFEDDGGAAPAGSAELARNVADAMAQEGTSLFGKALSIVTPSSAFDRNMLGLVQLGRRMFFYDGTVSKAAATDPNYKGLVPAEALKDLYSVHLYDTLRQLRQAYNPARQYGALLGRGEGGGVEVQTPKKIAAALSREPIRYRNAAGEEITIPAHAGYGQFTRHAVRILREQKAARDGFADISRQQVPEPLQQAADAIRGFYDQMLDLGDQAGLLPGKRTLAAAEAELEAAQDEVARILNEQPEPAPARLPGMEDDGATPVYTSVPETWRGETLYDWGQKGLRSQGNRPIRSPGGRPRKTFDTKWLADLERVPVGDPQLIRKLRTLTDEVWPVKERSGKWWNTRYYLAPKEAIAKARTLAAEAANSRWARQLDAAEAKLAKAQTKTEDLRAFADRAETYFTRRFLAENVRNDKSGFTAWLKRSWQRSRSLGHDPETGELVRLAEHERPLIDEVRQQLNIPESYRTEGDLIRADLDADPGLQARYEQAVADWFDEQAQRTWKTITEPEHRHGIETAYAGGSPLKHRRLVVDESDAAARQFLDDDPERILSAYFHTIGGRIATTTAIKRGRRMLGPGGAEIETPEQFLDLLESRFGELHEATADLDRAAGTRYAAQVQRHRHAAMVRFRRRIASLQGQGLIDGSAGANAMFEWAGRRVLGLNYLALLGSQTLSAVNDVAALTMFADITSLPRNVRYIAKAIAPLKQATRRDLMLMRLGFEGEQQRILALGDVDFDDAGAGVGFGRTRQVTHAIAVGEDRLQRAFGELTLINTWNRVVKRGAAMIAMDRLVTNSRGLIEADRLMAGGMERGAALRKAGLSSFDAGRLAEYGIDAPTARRLLAMIRKYGTDEDGNPLARLSGDEWQSYKGIALPNARAWLDGEGDAARELFDIYLTAINTDVERAMVLTPGQTDRPLVNDQWLGRAVNQFQTFGYALANQVIRPMAQRPAGKQAAGLFAYFGTATLVDAMRNHLAGRRSFDETMNLWQENPLGMTYSAVHTSGLSGWFNRPVAFFDRVGLGPGAWLGNTTIARAAYRSRTFWGSLSPTADLIDRTIYGGFGWTEPDGMRPSHWHAMRKSIPFQNLIWNRLFTRLTGQDPLLTETMMREQYGEPEPRP